jgi:hypothetical protein
LLVGAAAIDALGAAAEDGFVDLDEAEHRSASSSRRASRSFCLTNPAVFCLTPMLRARSGPLGPFVVVKRSYAERDPSQRSSLGSWRIVPAVRLGCVRQGLHSNTSRCSR